ncbi:MAG: hypothetical protein ACREA2_02460 [Blastocatellia bacterium]
MKSFLNQADMQEILDRFTYFEPGSRRQWGRMTPHQMICHLSDSFRFALGEKEISSRGNLFTRTVVK